MKEQHDIEAREGVPLRTIKTKLWLTNSPTGYSEDNNLFIFEKELNWIIEAEASVKCYHNALSLFPVTNNIKTFLKGKV